MLSLKIESTDQGPIYKQIARGIEENIAKGNLQPGDKLPTVRELSAAIGAACGTVKHAYEYLEERGIVEMVQGSGSFVLDRREDASSRKEQAMIAIDDLFSHLEKLGFTPREMEIYLNLKLRSLEEKYDVVKVAVVDCNPETLQLIQRQLSRIGYVETAAYDLNHIAQAADRLNTDYDLILTTTTHFAEVETYIKDERKLAMLVMTPAMRTTIALAKVPDDTRVGIFCASDAFSGVVRENCRGMAAWSDHMSTQLMGMAQGLEQFLRQQDMVIVPEGYDAFASAAERSALQHFAEQGGQLLCYDYTIDRGSFLYVEDRIRKCMNQKRSR